MIEIKKIDSTERFGMILTLVGAILIFFMSSMSAGMEFYSADLQGTSKAQFDFYKENYDALVDMAKTPKAKAKIKRELDLYLQGWVAAQSYSSSDTSSDNTYLFVSSLMGSM